MMKFILIASLIFSSCAREIKDNNLKLGTGTANDVIIEANIGAVNNPKLKYDEADSVWKFTNNGVDFSAVGAAGASTEDASIITDWNDAEVTGFFQGNNAANAPQTGKWFIGYAVRHNSLWITQEVWDFASHGLNASNQVKWRRQSNDVGSVRTWGPWYSVGDNKTFIFNSGSHTYTPRPHVKSIRIIASAAGGGSGGSGSSYNTTTASSGGGAGAGVECTINNPPTLSIVVGSGGSDVDNFVATGTTGGDTTISGGSVNIVLKGGLGGTRVTLSGDGSVDGVGAGSGSSTTGCNFTFVSLTSEARTRSGRAYRLSSYVQAGQGGTSIFGAAPPPRAILGTTILSSGGAVSGAPGSGASGALRSVFISEARSAGIAGRAGQVVIIEEYE